MNRFKDAYRQATIDHLLGEYCFYANTKTLPKSIRTNTCGSKEMYDGVANVLYVWSALFCCGENLVVAYSHHLLIS